MAIQRTLLTLRMVKNIEKIQIKKSKNDSKNYILLIFLVIVEGFLYINKIVFCDNKKYESS